MACPQFELLDRLRQKHLDSAKCFASRVARLADESSFNWIVNEIVSQPHPAKLISSCRRFVLMLAARAERRCVDDDVEFFKPRIRQRFTRSAELRREFFSLLRLARKQRNACAGRVQHPQYRARRAAGTD